MQGKVTKTEQLLMAAAIIFLCGLTGLFLFDTRETGNVRIETQMEATASQIAPEIGKINVNTADAGVLAELPGIGETLAERIVDYRTAHGAFHSKQELQKVKGIGRGKYAAIADWIIIG